MNNPALPPDRPRTSIEAFPTESMRSQKAPNWIAETQSFPLTMVSEGERVRIQSFQGGKGLMMRLTDLGLNRGTELRVMQRRGDGLIVARGEGRIALGGGMASKILVTVVRA